MRRQERKNAVRLQKMTRHRLRIQQFALTIRSTLHTRIIANNQRKQADRRAGLFRAFLGARTPYGGTGYPSENVPNAVVVDDAVGCVAHDIEIELAS